MLPLVLVAVAVILLFSGEAASRASREGRVTKVMEYSDVAFYAADSGFNRARARLTTAASPTEVQLDALMASLNGKSDTLMDSGVPVSQYSLQVSKTAALTYQVISTGTASGPNFATKRVVSGKLKATIVTGPPVKVTVTTTLYP